MEVEEIFDECVAPPREAEAGKRKSRQTANTSNFAQEQLGRDTSAAVAVLGCLAGPDTAP